MAPKRHSRGPQPFPFPAACLPHGLRPTPRPLAHGLPARKGACSADLVIRRNSADRAEYAYDNNTLNLFDIDVYDEYGSDLGYDPDNWSVPFDGAYDAYGYDSGDDSDPDDDSDDDSDDGARRATRPPGPGPLPGSPSGQPAFDNPLGQPNGEPTPSGNLRAQPAAAPAPSAAAAPGTHHASSRAGGAPPHHARQQPSPALPCSCLGVWTNAQLQACITCHDGDPLLTLAATNPTTGDEAASYLALCLSRTSPTTWSGAPATQPHTATHTVTVHHHGHATTMSLQSLGQGRSHVLWRDVPLPHPILPADSVDFGMLTAVVPGAATSWRRAWFSYDWRRAWFSDYLGAPPDDTVDFDMFMAIVEDLHGQAISERLLYEHWAKRDHGPGDHMTVSTFYDYIVADTYFDLLNGLDDILLLLESERRLTTASAQSSRRCPLLDMEAQYPPTSGPHLAPTGRTTCPSDPGRPATIYETEDGDEVDKADLSPSRGTSPSLRSTSHSSDRHSSRSPSPSAGTSWRRAGLPLAPQPACLTGTSLGSGRGTSPGHAGDAAPLDTSRGAADEGGDEEDQDQPSTPT